MCRLALLFLLGCGSRHEPPPPGETPEKQFIFEGMRIEERRAGELVWVGTAARADGDLSLAAARDVKLVHQDKAGAEDYEIRSPTADLAFDDGEARFTEVRITDPGGGLVTGGTAVYHEKQNDIAVGGPVAFQARGLVADATSGVIDLTTGTLDIVGPVLGRYTPPER